MKKLVIFVVGIFCFAAVYGEQAVFTGADFAPANDPVIKDAFKPLKPSVFSNGFIPADQTKSYKLSAKVKNLGKDPANILVGLRPFTAKKGYIYDRSINVVVGTDTVLAKDCASKDTSVFVKDASQWTKTPTKTVAFETDPSPAMKDLPTDLFVRGDVKEIKQIGDMWEIVMTAPIGYDYPIGTNVRAHANGNTFIYPIIATVKPGAEWITLEGIINPSLGNESQAGTANWWRGTAMVKVFLDTPENANILFGAIELTEKTE